MIYSWSNSSSHLLPGVLLVFQTQPWLTARAWLPSAKSPHHVQNSHLPLSLHHRATCCTWRALHFHLNSSSAQCFWTTHCKHSSLSTVPNSPHTLAAAVAGAEGYSIPVTGIWKWEMLTIPDHLRNLGAGYQTQTFSHTTQTTISQNCQLRNILPYYQMIPDTGTWSCYGDRQDGIPQLGTGLRALEAMAVGWHCSFAHSTTSFQTTTLAAASSTAAHKAIDNSKPCPWLLEGESKLLSRIGLNLLTIYLTKYERL